MKAIVTGMIATYPVGGVAWDYGQYALGLESMGWEVYYLEDTGWQTYDPTSGDYGEDPAAGVSFLSAALNQLSPALGQRWHFRSMSGEAFGIEAQKFENIIAEADLFLNVSGGTLLRDAYMTCRNKVLIDSDPGWNHFVNYPKWDAKPGWHGTHGYRAHDHFFTYAERIGASDCKLPELGLKWHPTRPPVMMDRWQSSGEGIDWTTVMTWNNFRRAVEYQRDIYGSKEVEFPKVELLPQCLPNVGFEMAVGGKDPPIEHWCKLGWKIVDSHSVSQTLDEYRQYIQQSRGEFSVAKNLYTATRSGWFSCRSVCYLAAGLPCVVQDTGFSEIIPTGEGLLTWTTLAEAEKAISDVESNYPLHRRCAREIAAEYFDAERVLGNLLAVIGL